MEECEQCLRLPEARLFLGVATAARLAAAGERFLLHYTALSHIAMTRGDLRYPFVVKAHYLRHTTCGNDGLNPAAIWTYMHEDFMGRMVHCAQRCIAGTPALLIGRKVAENYRVAFAIRMDLWRAERD